jgi:hypothetical protein
VRHEEEPPPRSTLSRRRPNPATLAFLAAVVARGVVTAVRSTGGSDGETAAKNIAKARSNRR